MLHILERCKSAFIGHAIASNNDPTISLPINVSESLLEHRQFNGRDILSRYLFSYHTKAFEIGETTRYIYNAALNNIQTTRNSSSITRQDFLLDQSYITELVKTIDKEMNGLTAGCGPAQRSFPLALCAWINDDDLFDISKNEAALTHFNPQAGQVAGVVNVICRLLLRNKTWSDSIRSAFTSAGISGDIINVSLRYMRSPDPYTSTHPAYAPTVLNAALYYVHQSTNAQEAIEKARTKGNCYCAPIVGFIAGIRWGIPLEMYAHRVNDPQIVKMCEMADKLSNTWPIQNQGVFN